MIRPLVTIPYQMMSLIERNWWIDWRGSPGAETTSGSTQVVMSQFPRWMGQLDFTFSRDKGQQWRALIWSGQGRVGTFRLYMADPLAFVRASVLTPEVAASGNPYSTGARFSTGQGFDPTPRVVAASAAQPGDSEIMLTITDAALVPVPGQIISADDWPMGVTYVVDEGANTYRVGVALQRATIAAGDLVSLVATGIFELTADNAGAASYGHQRITSPSVIFREVLNR